MDIIGTNSTLYRFDINISLIGTISTLYRFDIDIDLYNFNTV